jgi:hypothetical protein
VAVHGAIIRSPPHMRVGRLCNLPDGAGGSNGTHPLGILEGGRRTVLEVLVVQGSVYPLEVQMVPSGMGTRTEY